VKSREKVTYVEEMIIATQAGGGLGVLRDQEDRGGHYSKAVVHALDEQLT